MTTPEPSTSRHWPQVKRLRDLQTLVRTAAHWQALEVAIDRAQAHFGRGELSGPALEDLAEQCIVRSREIPEHGQGA